MGKRYYDLNTYFKETFGYRVHKITIDAGLSCPNRDGKISKKGCIYCNSKGSGTGANDKGISISEQLIRGKEIIKKRINVKKFLAYFQSYTNTYAPFDKLKNIYDEALSVEDIVGITIGTRPDCINEPIIKLLETYAKNKMIWIEYGLQSASNKTLNLINRGHDLDCFKRAVTFSKNRGIKICAHIILGLPNENKEDMLNTAKTIAGMEIDGIKFHSLYVIKGTELEKLYYESKYECLTQIEYVGILCEFLELLSEKTVIQRLTSDPHPNELIAPLWTIQKRETIDLINKKLELKDMRQGKKYFV